MLHNRKYLIYVNLALLVTAMVLVNLIGSRISLRFDTTRDGLYSLTEISRNILAELSEPVEIVHFYIAADPRYRPTLELLLEYERRSPLITTRAYDINTNPSVARNMGVSFQGTTIITMGERREEVFGGDEVSLTNGIYKLMHTDTRRIYFTDGHGEYDIFSMVGEDHLEGEGDEDRPIFVHEKRGLAKLRERLELMGYEAEKFLIAAGQPVPDDADLVVIASPEVSFRPEAVASLRAYIDQGRPALVMLDAFRDGGLSELLGDYGVVPGNDMVVDFGNHFWNDATAPATGSYTRHVITERLPLTFFPGVMSLQPANPMPEGVTTTVLFSSTNRSLSVPRLEDLSRLRNLDLEPASYPLMIISERTGTQGPGRLAIIGDGDVAANENLGVLGNERLILNTMNWLMGQTARLDMPAATYEVPMVNLTNRQMQFTFVISTVAVPLLFFATGLAVWLRRRRN
jgi:ABC-2 type transport system permease protein